MLMFRMKEVLPIEKKVFWSDLGIAQKVYKGKAVLAHQAFDPTASGLPSLCQSMNSRWLMKTELLCNFVISILIVLQVLVCKWTKHKRTHHSYGLTMVIFTPTFLCSQS